jgi:hypothetical protein
MTETSQAPRTQAGHSRSALGRLTLLVEVGDGTEKVTYERRWAEASQARTWCEDKLHQAPEGTAVLEIQVTEEVWGRRHAWEATASRHIPQTLQLGVRTRFGTVTWGSAHDVADDLSSQRRL